MTTMEALSVAKLVKEGGRKSNQHPGIIAAALVKLYEHGEKVEIPDLETLTRMVGAQIHARGKYIITIAVDPKTKEVASTFGAIDEHGGKN